MPAPGELVTIAAVHCAAQSHLIGAVLRVLGPIGSIAARCLDCHAPLGVLALSRCASPKGIVIWPDAYLAAAPPGAVFVPAPDPAIEARQRAATRKAERELALMRREAANKAKKAKAAKLAEIEAAASVHTRTRAPHLLDRTRPGRAADCQYPHECNGAASCAELHELSADPETLPLLEAAIARAESEAQTIEEIKNATLPIFTLRLNDRGAVVYLAKFHARPGARAPRRRALRL